ncbi:MAG: hypothetical protein GX892_01820 [Thermoanaerobacteraceae bacterium]|nr:hypothetical protein [Thermoanaerobacteraceae bacterium]
MKKTICVLLLVLSIFIMFSGLTMSYFHDKSKEIQIPFTTGKLVMEINDFPVIRDNEEWFPGKKNAKNLEWSFKNVGTQPAELRVKAEGKWDDDTLEDIVVWEQITGWEEKEDYYLYNKLVYPDDTVNIEFDVWLDLNKDNFNENYNSAKYTIKLTLESSQKEWD